MAQIQAKLSKSGQNLGIGGHNIGLSGQNDGPQVRIGATCTADHLTHLRLFSFSLFLPTAQISSGRSHLGRDDDGAGIHENPEPIRCIPSHHHRGWERLFRQGLGLVDGELRPTASQIGSHGSQQIPHLGDSRAHLQIRSEWNLGFEVC